MENAKWEMEMVAATQNYRLSRQTQFSIAHFPFDTHTNSSPFAAQPEREPHDIPKAGMIAMFDRRALKRQGRQTLRKHYFLLVLLCAVAIFLGTEFSYVTSDAQAWYDILTDRVTQVDVDGILLPWPATVSHLLDDLLEGKPLADREETAARMKAMKAEAASNPMLGRQKGVLAAVMNSVSSGHLYATLGAGISSIVRSGQAAATIMILGSLAIYLIVWAFLRNVYQAILRRAILEARTYDVMPLSHLFHLKNTGCWLRTSLTLLLSAVYEALWSLTIVGGWIKHYSYFLVPFIVAENPSIRPREAINLSRRMMKGHKWQVFLLDLSFFGWHVLGFLSFGVADVLWNIPYRTATCAGLYAALRAEARAAGLDGAALLDDDCLFAPADGELLRERYGDILMREDIVHEDIVQLPPVKRFFARNFGIWLGTLTQKKIYSRQSGLRQQMKLGELEMSGRAYPARMNPRWNGTRAALTGRVSYLTPCTVWTLIAVFFIFCIAGWLWEVSHHLITHGVLVNRGAMHGPWLPIYGSGVVMIAVLLYRLRSRPLLEAAAITVLCGAVEYLTSYFMELARGMRWWDYTGYFLNLNGRISGEGLAMFTIGGMLAVYLLIPIIDGMVIRVRPRLLISVCLALMLCFMGDAVYSHFVPHVGSGITDDPEVAAVENQLACVQRYLS